MLRAARNRTEPLLCVFSEACSISDTSRVNENWGRVRGEGGEGDARRWGLAYHGGVVMLLDVPLYHRQVNGVA